MAERAGAAGFERMERSADVGIRSWGDSPAEAFEQAALGLGDLMGIGVTVPDDHHTIMATAPDLEALLVEFLNELILLHESEGLGIGDVRVELFDDAEPRLEAEVGVAPLSDAPGGRGVRSATYHRLAVAPRPDGRTEARVYLDT